MYLMTLILLVVALLSVQVQANPIPQELHQRDDIVNIKAKDEKRDNRSSDCPNTCVTVVEHVCGLNSKGVKRFGNRCELSVWNCKNPKDQYELQEGNSDCWAD
ncbi:hypothetical protein BGX33_010216 [Mortierella sp. NVP41]|nr:hypothetical protein BGX33_010216 [Mortierella sp. NVP41]